MSIWSRAGRIARNRKPYTWAVCYLVTFLVFGCGYWILSALYHHSFYQSTSRYEPRYQEEEERVGRHVQEDIGRVLKLTVAADEESGGYTPVADQVRVSGFRILPDSTVSLLVLVPVTDHRQQDLRYTLLYTVTGNLIGDEVTLKARDYILQSVQQSAPGARQAFPQAGRVHEIAIGNPLWSVFRNGDVPALEGPDFNTVREIRGLIEESEGWASVALPSYGVRMFYLSAITITTTGYGDILPLTTVARILCGFEALLGTLWFGLFIYSLPART